MNAPHHLFMTADAVGGVWRYAVELARALVPLGYRTTLALCGPPPVERERACARAVRGLRYVETGLELDWLADRPERIVEASRRIAALARQMDADIVHLNSPALACAGDFGAPVVAVDHGGLGPWWHVMEKGPPPENFRWHGALAAEGLSRARACVCPSEAYARLVRQCYGLPEQPQVVHNGRHSVRYSPRAMHDFAFTSGRLWDRAKNIGFLDGVADRIAIPFKAAGGTTAPDGQRIELRNIVPLGSLDERGIWECLASRPIYVSAALHEPFGLSVLEAAEARCALILSDIPTFRELWEGAALFVRPDDGDAFAHVIQALAGDVRSRLLWGERAHRRARRYRSGPMAARMDEIYGRCMADTLPSPASLSLSSLHAEHELL